MNVTIRLKTIEDRIQAACDKAGRRREEVRLVAVSKASSPEEAVEVARNGIMDFGENRLAHFAEMRETFVACGLQARWHMIGHLQRNKAKQFLPLMDILHSLESIKLARVLNDLLTDEERTLEVFVQVNCSKEPQKYGLNPERAPDFIASLAEFDRLVPVGLMTMAAFDGSDSEITRTFELAGECLERSRGSLTGVARKRLCRLSMGMTNDFEIAIACGATDLRVGSAIFA
jgi:pyridoxal phosphate enzyme (YggS family)